MWWCRWPYYDWDKHGANMIHIVIVIVIMIIIMVMMMMMTMKIMAMTWLLMVGTWCCEYSSQYAPVVDPKPLLSLSCVNVFFHQYSSILSWILVSSINYHCPVIQAWPKSLIALGLEVFMMDNLVNSSPPSEKSTTLPCGELFWRRKYNSIDYNWILSQ